MGPSIPKKVFAVFPSTPDGGVYRTIHLKGYGNYYISSG